MFREDLKQTIQSYCMTIPELSADGRMPSDFLIEFAIEQFKQVRHYPTSFSEERIEQDLERNKNTIAMAVIDVFSKEGAENQLSASEGGTVRKYENAFISSSLFRGVTPFVHIL